MLQAGKALIRACLKALHLSKRVPPVADQIGHSYSDSKMENEPSRVTSAAISASSREPSGGNSRKRTQRGGTLLKVDFVWDVTSVEISTWTRKQKKKRRVIPS